MNQIRTLPWINLIVCGLILVLGIIVDLRVHANPMGDVLARIPTMVDGLYAPEQSDYLQTTHARTDGSFRWSKPSVLFTFWPAPPTSRIFTLTYSAPQSSIRIETARQYIGEIPITPLVRTAHILTPADPAFEIYLQSTNPHRSENESRELGFIFLTVSWQGTNDISLTWSTQWWLLVRGIGLSTLLAMLLLVVMQQALRRAAFAGLGVVVGMWLLGSVTPWVAVALQPTLQFVFATGIIGVTVHRLLPQFVVPHKHAHIIILGVWVISFLFFFRPQINSDGVGYYAYVRSLFIDGDFDFANEFDRTLSPFPNTPTFPVYEPTGYTSNPWSVGPAMVWTPFWLIGHGIVWITSGFNVWAMNGYTSPYVALTCLASSMAGLFTMYAMYALLRRWFSDTIALATSIGMFLGTNLLYYVHYEGSYPHSISALLATWCVLFTVQLYENADAPRWHWVRFGLSVGWLVLYYWMNGIICLFPAVFLLYRAWQLYGSRDWVRLQRHIIGIVIAVATVLLTLAPQFIVWYSMYKQFFQVYNPGNIAFVTVFGTKISSGLFPSENHIVEYFIGPTYGMVWWTPLYVLGLCGCWLMMRVNKMIGVWSFIVIAIYIAYNATTTNWHGSGGFGMRRMTSMLPFMAIGVAYCAMLAQRIPHVLTLAWSVAVGWELRLLARYLQYSRDRGPDNFLSDLSSSLLSPDITASTSFMYTVNLSWWLHQLVSPSLGGVIVSGSLGLCIWAIIMASKRHMTASR